MIFTILAAFYLFGADVLDSEMSAEDKKSTGIYKLTNKEKAALQQWIDANYQKKSAAFAPSKNINPILSENLLNGRYLRLSDGTLWHVRPEDVPIAQVWITPVGVAVSQSADPFFSYKLTNQVSGTSILARKAEQLPPRGSAPLTPTEKDKTS